MSVRVCSPSYLIVLFVSILSDTGRAASGGHVPSGRRTPTGSDQNHGDGAKRGAPPKNGGEYGVSRANPCHEGSL